MLITIYRYMLFICLITIEYLSVIPKGIDLVHAPWDKTGFLEHTIAFSVLYILMRLAFRKLSMFKTFGLLFLFAIQIEVVQYFIKGRASNILDIWADIFGVVVVISLLWMYKIFYKNHQKQ